MECTLSDDIVIRMGFNVRLSNAELTYEPQTDMAYKASRLLVGLGSDVILNINRMYANDSGVFQPCPFHVFMRDGLPEASSGWATTDLVSEDNK